MWIALVVVVLIVLAVAAATRLRRPRGDDLNSVRSYHSALGTLEHLSDRTVRPAVEPERAQPGPSDPASEPGAYGRSSARPAVSSSDRVPLIGREAVTGPRTTARPPLVPPVPVRGNDEFPDPETPLIFDDARPKDRYANQAAGDLAPLARTDRAQRHALDSMNHRPRRSMTVMIVVAVLVLFGVLAYVGSKRSTPSSHATSSPASTSPRPLTKSSPATTRPTRGAAARGGHRTSTRTTVAPTPTKILASSSTSYSAIYPVVTNSYRITVTGTGQCWVAATTVSTGSTLWAGTLQAGTVQVIEATGATSVQLGTPAATMTINKVPVVFPSPTLSPFVATFQPPSSTSAVGAATTTTTVPSTSPGTATSSTTTSIASTSSTATTSTP